MALTLSFDEYWPQWPSEVQGQCLVDVRLKTTIPELIDILWSPDSAFLAEANSERNYVDYHCTDWVTAETDLPDLPGGFDWTHSRTRPTHSIENIGGKMRKVRFQTRSGALLSPRPFKTEEVQRCISCEEKEMVTVDACVSTTAPFCENIRVLVRYKIEAVGETNCRLFVCYHVEYLQAVNLFVRSVLEKGTAEGLRSNFSTFSKVLLSYAPNAIEAQTLPAPAPEPDMENLHVPSEEKYPYETALNWKALPPVSLIHTLRSIRTTDSRFIVTLRVIAKMLGTLVFCVLLGCFFKIWCLLRQTWMKQVAVVVPPMEFREGLVTALLFIFLLEMTQLSIYHLKRSLDSTRLHVIHAYEAVSRFLAKLRAVNHRTLHGASSFPREDSLHADSLSERDTDAVSEAHGDGEKGEEDSESFINRFADGVYRLMNYTSSDFRRFDHSISVEARTNPDGSVVEEVFENERLQPFRGWGHLWPGHFLPTDKFSHWSSFDEEGNIVTCDVFSRVAPSLPPGWQWREDKWKVDLSKLGNQSVDAAGWYYSLDFPWIKFTPEKNNGIRRMSDFVRRRRWIRTRARQDQTASRDAPPAEDEKEKASESTTPYFSILQFL